MKKLFIGLLIVAAAGAGVFFALRNVNKPANSNIQKQWIVGSWKLDSLAFKEDSGSRLPNILVLLDSNLTRYRYEFTKDSMIRTSLGDSLTADSSRYEWSKTDELIWKDASAPADSLKVITLSKDSLVLHDRDSTVLFFTKAR